MRYLTGTIVSTGAGSPDYEAGWDRVFGSSKGLEAAPPRPPLRTVVQIEGERLLVSCDLARDRTWEGQWRCETHALWFRFPDGDEPEGCPVHAFAQELLRP